MESVLIQESRMHNLLNSKSEYNRCALPRLATKIGENDYKKWEENNKEEKEKEKELENKIRELRIKRNLNRRTDPTDFQMPASKKRKLTSEKYSKVMQTTSIQEKRKGEQTSQERQEKKRKIGPLDNWVRLIEGEKHAPTDQENSNMTLEDDENHAPTDQKNEERIPEDLGTTST